jgi:enterochelin esterase-like enzyme
MPAAGLPTLQSADTPDRFLLPWSGSVPTLVPAGNDARPALVLPQYITASGRDLRIDLLRGYFVLAMIIDHVLGVSPLWLITGGNRFFTSAAEGFILTSGLMAGLVYHRVVQQAGLVAAVQKIMLRTIALYLLTVAMTLLIVPVPEVYGLRWAQGLDLSDPVTFLLNVLTLHRTYYLADVMLLYTVFFMILPVALFALERGWTAWLLGMSVAIWALHQIVPDAVTVIWPIAGNYLFEFSAWQLLFFGGLALGYKRNSMGAPTTRGAQRLHWITGAGTLSLLLLCAALYLPPSRLPAPIQDLSGTISEAEFWLQINVFGKSDLRGGRLLASAVVFTFMFQCLTRWWKYLRHARVLLAPLGQNALYAFALHAAVAVGAQLLLTPLGVDYVSPPAVNAAFQIAAVALIWVLARSRFLMPTQRTLPFWYASPVIMVLAALVFLPLLRVQPVLAQPLELHPKVIARAKAYGTVIAAIAVPAGGTAMAQATPASSNISSTIVATQAPPATQVPPVPKPTKQADAQPTLVVEPELTAAPATAQTPLEFPPLPPDDQSLVSEYVGTLKGRAYARSMYSPLLYRDMIYWIYLPPGYGDTDRRYPVVYALHGGGGLQDEWAAYGLFDMADRGMAAGTLIPFIIVLPHGERSYFANWAANDPAWGEYLAYEIVGEVDQNFGTLRSPAARAVGGLSIGGWGALHQGFTYPNVPGVVASSSPSLYEGTDELNFLGTGAEFASKDPVVLAQTAPVASSLKIWLDTGEQDPWVDTLTTIHNSLTDRQIPHEWHLYPGFHAPGYWVQHVPDYLRFFSQALAGG